MRAFPPALRQGALLATRVFLAGCLSFALVGCGSEGADGQTLPDCDRASDFSTPESPGCLYDTATSLGYQAEVADSFVLAYRLCHDTPTAELIARFGGKQGKPRAVARKMSLRLFNDRDSEAAGWESCLLALSDLGLTTD